MCSAEDKSDRSLLTDEIIVAIITPPGEGGVAALRLAGGNCLKLFKKHFNALTDDDQNVTPFLMRLGSFVDKDGQVLDEIMAVFMPAGRSYTGLDQVELFCHGGRTIVKLILDELILSGARSAEPGEFTKLAFLSGRIDLAKAEAVAEIIAANSRSSYVTAKEHLLGNYTDIIEQLRSELISLLAEVEARIDFPEDEIEETELEKLLNLLKQIMQRLQELIATYNGGRIIKEGFKIAIGGRPNAGKSSLFNRLLKQQRAIVTPTAGTTRDYLSEWIELDGFAVNLIDTAGIRKKGGQIEREGQKSALKLIEESDLLLWLFDLADPEVSKNVKDDIKPFDNNVILLVGNKLDLIASDLEKSDIESSVSISCKTGEGFEVLLERIVEEIRKNLPDQTAGITVTSARHKEKLEVAKASLENANESLSQNESPELIAFELRQAINALDEITGRVYNEEILAEIFSKFCIGK